MTALSLVGCTGSAPTGVEAPVPTAKTERGPAPRERQPIEIVLPKLAGDASCQQARSAYVESWEMARGSSAADLSRGQFGMILARDSYFDHCGVPATFEVSICAAIQNGQVLGATVATKPRAPRLERCIDRGVRRLSFPAHPRMDVTRTVFRP